MLAGGLFLIWKSVHEIHGNMEGAEEGGPAGGKRVSFVGVIVQIVLFDIVFSLDSVITAVGMAQQIPIMIAAVVLAMILMMFASGAIGGFVNRHPTIKMLALAFLLVIGVVLVAEGFRQHVSKGYIYFAMAFSFVVELLNLRMRARRRKLAAAGSSRGVRRNAGFQACRRSAIGRLTACRSSGLVSPPMHSHQQAVSLRSFRLQNASPIEKFTAPHFSSSFGMGFKPTSRRTGPKGSA